MSSVSVSDWKRSQLLGHSCYRYFADCAQQRKFHRFRSCRRKFPNFTEVCRNQRTQPISLFFNFFHLFSQFSPKFPRIGDETWHALLQAPSPGPLRTHSWARDSSKGSALPAFHVLWPDNPRIPGFAPRFFGSTTLSGLPPRRGSQGFFQVNFAKNPSSPEFPGVPRSWWARGVLQGWFWRCFDVFLLISLVFSVLCLIS